MVRLRSKVGLTKAIVMLPVALCLWPLIAWNYRQRKKGLLPDEWHWADALLFRLGYYVESL